jgi:aspartate aminotransferase
MEISQKIKRQLTGASWIRSMFEEGERLRAIHGPAQVFDFTLGNPIHEPPAAFQEELKRLALNPLPGMHRYMSNAGYLKTRQAVAEMLAEETNLPFQAKHIVMTCGAGGALNVVLKTLLDEGDEVIVLVPYFMEYKFYIDNHGGVIKEIRTAPDFQPDLSALEEVLTLKTKAVIINSPHNPTGVVYDAGKLTGISLLLQAKEKETGKPIYLISDEPYAKIIYEKRPLPSIFNVFRRSIVVTSYSKDLALPGERIGYIAVHPEIPAQDILIEGLVFCNRTLGFVNAPALMQHLGTPLQRVKVDVSLYQEKRDLLYDNLTRLGFKMVKPQGAFYLFPQSPIPDDIAFVRLAQKYRILMVPGSGFGLPGYFRLSYCVDKQTIINALPAFSSLAQEAGLVSKV